jgi:ABC-type transport system involved in multi-copper enzyme maturation permease subunit
MTTEATRPFGALRDVGNGVVAVGVKELRGRMRGRRAFVVLTVHLLLVGGFAWMVEVFSERSVTGGFGSTFSASADIGRALFTALMLLLTLVVLVLAPASTAGAISLEREKQTLDLLATTPISSLAIVLGKLLSALTWMFLLLLASIPVSALVFTFGGVAPDDLFRGYLVLFGTAIAFGTIGLFVSALVKRTQAATVINLVTVLALTAGTTVLFIFWTAMGTTQAFNADGSITTRDSGPIAALTRRPPEVLMYFNPFIAELDVICGTETGYGGSCSLVGAITNRNPNDVAAVPLGGAAVDQFGAIRDTYWPRSMLAMAVVSVILIVLSAQLVTPTRRWRRPRSVRSDAVTLE